MAFCDILFFNVQAAITFWVPEVGMKIVFVFSWMCTEILKGFLGLSGADVTGTGAGEEANGRKLCLSRFGHDSWPFHSSSPLCRLQGKGTPKTQMCVFQWKVENRWGIL